METERAVDALNDARLVAPRVQVVGEVAVLTFKFRGFGPDDSGAEVQRSDWHTTEVYARSGESWRLASTHWSYTASMLARLAAARAFSGAAPLPA
jgi:hypothetical protein